MTLREKLKNIAQPYDLFSDLTDAEKEIDHILVCIAHEIYQRRTDLNWTQKKLAEAMQVSQSMVCQWESGDYNFTVEKLVQIFDTLGLKLNISSSEKVFDVDQPVLAHYGDANESSNAASAPTLYALGGAA